MTPIHHKRNILTGHMAANLMVTFYQCLSRHKKQPMLCQILTFLPRNWGGGGDLTGAFTWPFLFISQGKWKTLFFHLRIGCISTIPCGHLFYFTHFPHKKNYFRKLQSPPPYSTESPLTVCLWIF